MLPKTILEPSLGASAQQHAIRARAQALSWKGYQASQQKLLFVLCLSRYLNPGLQTQNHILQVYHQGLLELGR